MTALEGEVYRRAFPTIDEPNPPYTSHGLQHQIACAHHVKETFKRQRAYIWCSASLAKNTDEVKKLEEALGDRHAGTYAGVAPHTPWPEVLAVTNDAREKKADCLITIGGGSLVDGAKAMLLFLANDVSTMPHLMEFATKMAGSLLDAFKATSKSAPSFPCRDPNMPLICIPTTLSGGEYSIAAGGTDPETHHKLVMGHPLCGPSLIINDPKLTVTCPEWVWLSTGVRAIDHCVEALSRLKMPDTEVDDDSEEALRLIVPNLLVTNSNWANEQARLKCMIGVNRVLIMLKKRVMPGASHGIGHQLGPLGVGHGETSCILLPAVMKYNASVNAARQQRVKNALWSEKPVADVLRRQGLSEAKSDAGDALDAVFRELGMPRSLHEKGVGRDKFDALAVNSLKDPCCAANPIPMERKEQVLEVLEMVA